MTAKSGKPKAQQIRDELLGRNDASACTTSIGQHQLVHVALPRNQAEQLRAHVVTVSKARYQLFEHVELLWGVLQTDWEPRLMMPYLIELEKRLKEFVAEIGGSMNDSDLIPFGAASERIPGRPNYITLWRWSTIGLAGVKLPTALVGGRRFVSVAAIDRFFKEVTAARAKERRARKSRKKTARAKR
jgi:hypothetical protein